MACSVVLPGLRLVSEVLSEFIYREGMGPAKNELASGVSGRPLAARWHRVDAGVQRVRDATNSDHPYACLSAVADTLDALYDLWELWKEKASLDLRAQDACVNGDGAGETAAALIFARGSKTHALVTFGVVTDTFTDTFHETYGCWRWQHYSEENPRYATRIEWFGTRVSGHEVLPPLVDAVAWLRTRPELI